MQKVGVAFDQSDEKVLRIYHNGQYLSGQDVRGMKGETWPLVIVAGGATLEVRNPPKLSLKSAIIFADGLLRAKSQRFLHDSVVAWLLAGELRDVGV